jgi:acyl-CoA thioesterase
VDFQVVRSRDGGTLSTRQVTARQDGEVLLEALTSFSTPVDGIGHQLPMIDVPQPNPCRTMPCCTAAC